MIKSARIVLVRLLMIMFLINGWLAVLINIFKRCHGIWAVIISAVITLGLFIVVDYLYTSYKTYIKN